MNTEDVLKERKATHGEYSYHARCTQAMMRALQREEGWEQLPDIIKETLHMISHKMARAVTGNPYLADHWIDIQGYSKLIEQRIEDKVGLREGHRPCDLQDRVVPQVVVSEHTTTNYELKRVGQLERETRTTETARIYVDPEQSVEADQGCQRANIGHPGELSARFLDKDDVGRLAIRRDGQTVQITEQANLGFMVERGDGATYRVQMNGFIHHSEAPNDADIRQVLK